MRRSPSAPARKEWSAGGSKAADAMDSTYSAPNTTSEYRQAREKLYAAERELLDDIERVAQLRRALPQGPEIPDYAFEGVAGTVRLSELFKPNREPSRHVPHHVLGGRRCVLPDVFGMDRCARWGSAARRTTELASSPRFRRRGSVYRNGRNGAAGIDIALLSDVGTDLADAVGARDTDNNPDSTVAVFSKEGQHVASRLHDASQRWQGARHRSAQSVVARV